jgi:hypothetical protein
MTGVKGLVLIALLLVLAVFAIRALVRIYEPRILFHPEMGLAINPGIVGMEYEDVAIRSGELFIHGWFFPAESDKYLIYYHGNAGTIADRIEFVKDILPLKLNVLMIDYRGYGKSEGMPTIEGTRQDAIAAVAWMMATKKAPTNKIILWGHSLGAAAALIAANHYRGVSGVIVESGFVSARRLALELFPIIPVAFVTDAFNNGDIVETLQVPKLFIHGTVDNLVPFGQGKELFRRATGQKLFVPIKGASHSDLSRVGGGAYLDAIKEWIGSLEAE